MYNFRYDHWDKNRFPRYVDKMNKLYDRSRSNYLSNNPKSSLRDLKTLDDIFGYMEYYLASILKNKIVVKKNFNNVFEHLRDISLVSLLDKELRSKLNGLTREGVIIINPDPGCFIGHNQEESLEIALYHELGHIITYSNRSDVEFFVKAVYKEDETTKKLFDDGYDDFERGFELLDEVAVQNVAEDVFYDRKGKGRKTPIYMENKDLYKGEFLSNFAEYQESQELVYKFAKCLDFIPTKDEDTMDEVLNKFSREMFSRDFCSNLFREFISDPEKGHDLQLMLMCLGRIKDAKYSLFGLGTLDKDDCDVTYYYQLFNRIADSYSRRKNNNTDGKIQR